MINIIYILMCDTWSLNRYVTEPVCAYKDYEEACKQRDIHQGCSLQSDISYYIEEVELC